MCWSQLIHLGDLPLTSGAAAATVIWLMAARAWRLAMWWALLYAFAIGMVAASKVAYLIWRATPPFFDFHALSGHATGFTAVAMTLLFLLPPPHPRNAQVAFAGGLGLGALMVAILVAHGDHTMSEAVAGWFLGGTVATIMIGISKVHPPLQVPHGYLCSSAAFLATVLLVHHLPLGYLMVKAARVVAHHTGGFPHSLH